MLVFRCNVTGIKSLKGVEKMQIPIREKCVQLSGSFAPVYAQLCNSAFDVCLLEALRQTKKSGAAYAEQRADFVKIQKFAGLAGFLRLRAQLLGA